jgi:hypothetical protein
VYQYDDVPIATYNALMAAPSKGRFVSAFIKDQYAASRTG